MYGLRNTSVGSPTSQRCPIGTNLPGQMVNCGFPQGERGMELALHDGHGECDHRSVPLS
jgi:hypothetical protein